MASKKSFTVLFHFIFCSYLEIFTFILKNKIKGCSDIRILSSGNAQQTSIKPTAATNPTTVKPTVVTNPPTVKPTATTDGSVPIYGQCGGINYTGPTRCNQGLTCFKQTDYYSQCLTGDCPFTWACQESSEVFLN